MVKTRSVQRYNKFCSQFSQVTEIQFIKKKSKSYEKIIANKQNNLIYYRFEKYRGENLQSFSFLSSSFTIQLPFSNSTDAE